MSSTPPAAPGAAPRPTEGLLDFLTLDQVDRDVFLGSCHDGVPQRAFGGQVAAQALTAAGATVDPRHRAHSLHGYFLRAGDPGLPIRYEVERLREGGSYRARRVTAVQHGEAIFTLSASFKLQESIPGRHIAMPEATPPDELPDAFRLWAENDPEGHGQAGIARALDVRLSPPRSPAEPGSTEQRIWVRSAAPLPDDPLVHMCAFTYASDLMLAPMTVLDVEAPGPLRGRLGASRYFLTSLDHAVWFLRPFRADEWLLVAQRSPTAGDGRGLAQSSVWTRDGDLVATVIQETVLRPFRTA